MLTQQGVLNMGLCRYEALIALCCWCERLWPVQPLSEILKIQVWEKNLFTQKIALFVNMMQIIFHNFLGSRDGQRKKQTN